MGTSRRVTEEDLHVTEALIADSFARLKRSITEAPQDAIRPMTSMVREHPLAATAAAAGAGVVAYQLAKMIFASGPVRKETRKGKGILGDIMGQGLSMAAPYIASVIQHQLGKALTGERR
jgi:hypothetical protein